MKIRRSGSRNCRGIVLLATAMTMSAGVAMATPGDLFDDDFPGPTLDPAWVLGGDPAGGLGFIFLPSHYSVTDAHNDAGSPDGFKLQRFQGGFENTNSKYVHSIDVNLAQFFLAGSGGVQSDFKLKSFGANGFVELVLNSFGDMRMFHNDFDGNSGNVVPNTNIGLAEGDNLNLTVNYNGGPAGTADVTYSINGGPNVVFHSGMGFNGAPIGDVVTSFQEAEVFKWGNNEPTQSLIHIDKWSLIPEPGSVALFGVGSMILLAARRRK